MSRLLPLDKKTLDSGTHSRVHTTVVINGNGTALRSGELARLTGVSSDTLRHYERLKILPESPRTSSGYRIYGRDSVERVLLVQRALQLGFTLSELSEILLSRDRGDVPCHRVVRMMEEKLHLLEQQIKQLKRTQLCMRQLVEQWKRRLAHTAPGKTAMLLHSLGDNTIARRSSAQNLRRRKG